VANIKGTIMPNSEETALHSITSHFALIDAQSTAFNKTRISDRIENKRPISIAELLRQLEAERQKARLQIEQKAASLGGFPGNPVGEVVELTDGWMRSFQNCDIYYRPESGAHEVEGDIRAKYNHLKGANGPLGFPITDETAAPDGVGRYNHFQHGSIYWTPRTGPMMVRGAIRHVWAASGWELGTFGYPVADEYHAHAFAPSGAEPIAWSRFENSTLVTSNGVAAEAVFVPITAAQLRGLVRSFFDKEIHKSPDNIGLHPEVETLSVTEWRYGFWSAVERGIKFRLHGFRDNGAARDADFELDAQLRFSLVSPSGLSEPSSKTLVAWLESLRVSVRGPFSDSIAHGVHDGVHRGFFRGSVDPDHSEVPDGAVFVHAFATGINRDGTSIDVIDVLTTAEGGLMVMLNPLPPELGAVRKNVAETTINNFLESQ
jgi:LGFP repeat